MDKTVYEKSVYISLILLSIFFTFQKAYGAPSMEDNKAKMFISRLVKGQYTQAYESFDSEVKKGLTEKKLEYIWKSLLSQAGEYKAFGETRQFSKDNYETFIVTTVFSKATIDVKVVFTKKNLVTGFFFVPHSSDGEDSMNYKTPPYVRKGSFTSREVTIGRGRWALPGTLLLPGRKAPFPALILVHGSGPNDRDETIGPNKPFRDIAEGLASKGIAVLRYEKRTRHYGASMTSKELSSLTLSEETIDDAAHAVELLKRVRQISNQNIFVLGHSLGGMAIPAIAAKEPAIAGFIIMAGNSRPLEELLIEQYRYIFGLDSEMSEEEMNALKDLEEKVSFLHSGNVTTTTSKSKLPLNLPPAYWLHLNCYDPVEMASKISRPVLVLQGARDYQVTSKDLDQWKKAFSNNTHASFRTYPALNHIFVSGEGKCTPEEYSAPGNVDEEVITDIYRFIKSCKP